MPLWFNVNGILHDGIGLVLCDVCPCVDSSSIVDSSSMASDSCTSSTCVETCCCPGVQIPTTLTVVFEGGSCAGTYSAQWYVFDGVGEWSSEDTPTTFRFNCSEVGNGECIFILSMDISTQIALISQNCDPFELVYDVYDPNCGTFTVRITG